jgi:hypothetical protein
VTESLEKRVEEVERRLLALEELGRGPPATTPKPAVPSPREFLQDKTPMTNNDKALAAGYYIEILTGKEFFGLNDLESFFNQAKEANPRNPSLPPFLNVKNGYFREVGEKDDGGRGKTRWALTNSGIARVEHGFKKGGSE